MHLAVVIPALNEEEALPWVLASLNEALSGLDWKAIVVDNGSTDRTAEVAKAGGATVLFRAQRGYGGACLTAIEQLSNEIEPPSVLAILDADGADDPRFLRDFVSLIDADEADLVLSTRTQGGAEKGSLGWIQRWGNHIQCAALNRRFGLHLTDMGPMRAIRFDLLLRLGMQDPSWGWNVEMAARAAKAGWRIQEQPVSYAPRKAGKSKISGSVSGAIRAGSRILFVLARYCR